MRSKTLILAGALTATTVTALSAQSADGLSAICRQEIVELCGTDRTQVRPCLMQKRESLSAACKAELAHRSRARRAADQAIEPTRRISIGEHERQALDFYAPVNAGKSPPPLIVYVHGGGWNAGSHTAVHKMPQHFTEAGYAFASVGYRVLPEAPVEAQAEDIGLAINVLRDFAAAWGYDRNRIILMGHSAGAHLSALVATDPKFAGDAFDALKGVILIDSAAYDLAKTIEDAGPVTRLTYTNAFGTDPERHMQLSPVTHVGGRDAPNWLILFDKDRAASVQQSANLMVRLSTAGAKVEAVAISDTNHSRIKREIGTPEGNQQTRAIDRFIAGLSD